MSPRKAENKTHEDTREALIHAARAAFGKHGFDGARVDRIAKAAGVNKALINYHFKSKRGLFLAIIEFHVSEICRRLDDGARPQDPPEKQLRCFIQTLSGMIRDFPSFSPMMMHELLGGARHLEHPPGLIQVVQRLQVILASGIRSGAFRQVNPFFTHIHILSSLIFFQISTPLRERFAKQIMGRENPFASEQFSLFVEEQVLAGLKNDSGSNPAARAEDEKPAEEPS